MFTVATVITNVSASTSYGSGRNCFPSELSLMVYISVSHEIGLGTGCRIYARLARTSLYNHCRGYGFSSR
jgi:hypothetical protein